MTDKNSPSAGNDNLAFRAALARGLVSRRSAMMGAAGLSAAAFLAACGSEGRNPSTPNATGGGAAPSAKAAQDMSDTEKVVNWSNWTEYIDVTDDGKSRPSIDAFTKATGIKVNYTEDYLDNDEFYAKVRPLLEGGQDTGRDIWCSTDWMVARLIRQGYVQKLDMANIPNSKNLNDSLKNVEFDPGRAHSLPWQSGFAGIGYNRSKVTAAQAPKTWKDILSPAYKDGISAKLSTSGMQHMQWYTLRKLYGGDFWQEFAKQRPKGFDSRAQLFDRLAKGDDRVCALAEYAGYTLFKEKGAEIDFVAPGDGLPATPALIGVVNRAPHPEAAKLFLDWAISNRGQAVYQTQTILLYGSVRNDAPPMATGKKLSDFKLLFPTDWSDFQASHGAFVKEWNALMGL